MEQRVDWKRIIMDLGSRGYTLEAIADHVGTAKQSVHQWKEGSEPRYTDGKKIIDLWHAAMSIIPMQVDDRRLKAHCK